MNEVYENLGCDGGYVSTSLQYVIDRGLVLDREYPYRNRVILLLKNLLPKFIKILFLRKIIVLYQKI